jgi:hypothetical protein
MSRSWGRFAKIPGVGRVGVGFERDGNGSSNLGIFESIGFKTQLDLMVFGPDGRPKQTREYMPFWARFMNSVRGNSIVFHAGSGKVTNIGVNNMANDFTWANGATLKMMNYQAIGTGTTADAATDYYLQTPITSGNLTGSTNGYMTGTQSWVQPNIYRNVATFTANATLAVAEWGLFMSNAASFSRTATGTPTATTFPDSGAAFTTSGNALQNWAIEVSSTAVNTPTSTVWGQITSNTATSLTIPGWLTLANAGASTPAANQAYVIYPGMWDHKQFSTVNLNTGDSLQVTYSLTINSGG